MIELNSDKTFGILLKKNESSNKIPKEFYFELNLYDMTLSYKQSQEKSFRRSFGYKQVFKYSMKISSEEQKYSDLKLTFKIYLESKTLILFCKTPYDCKRWIDSLKNFFDKKQTIMQTLENKIFEEKKKTVFKLKKSSHNKELNTERRQSLPKEINNFYFQKFKVKKNFLSSKSLKIAKEESCERSNLYENFKKHGRTTKRIESFKFKKFVEMLIKGNLELIKSKILSNILFILRKFSKALKDFNLIIKTNNFKQEMEEEWDFFIGSGNDNTKAPFNRKSIKSTKEDNKILVYEDAVCNSNITSKQIKIENTENVFKVNNQTQNFEKDVDIADKQVSNPAWDELNNNFEIYSRNQTLKKEENNLNNIEVVKSYDNPYKRKKNANKLNFNIINTENQSKEIVLKEHNIDNFKNEEIKISKDQNLFFNDNKRQKNNIYLNVEKDSDKNFEIIKQNDFNILISPISKSKNIKNLVFESKELTICNTKNDNIDNISNEKKEEKVKQILELDYNTEPDLNEILENANAAELVSNNNEKRKIFNLESPHFGNISVIAQRYNKIDNIDDWKDKKSKIS